MSEHRSHHEEEARLDPHSLGGQAVMEGVMMRSPRWWALAVRRPEGTIHTESHRVAGYLERRPALGKALIRGVLGLGESLAIGIRALSISARISAGQEGEELSPREVATAVALAVVVVVVLFVVLPALLIGGGEEEGLFVAEPALVVDNLVEGGVRIGIFLAYVVGVSFLKDIRRVFQYHGAEHKVIAAYEAGAPPTPEGARPHSTIHVRCGTNFLFLVMLLAVVVFSVVGRTPWWWRVGSRILLLPVVAALSYEVLRFAARHEGSLLVRAITWPGLLLQRVTTREPSVEQMEVALAALGELAEREREAAGPAAEDAGPSQGAEGPCDGAEPPASPGPASDPSG